jgi:exopolyphosphatase/pppGpp-phosphohydrolase
MEDILLPLYAKLRQQLEEGICIVTLHMGREHSGIAMGEGPTPQAVLPLPLGQERTARDYFKTTPPTALAMEHAIEGVENVVMPLHKLIPRDAQLFSQDTAMREIAVLAGVPVQARMVLSLDAMERLFDRLALLVQGTPASQLGLPASNRFAATLLVLREFMHHLQFAQITVLQTVDANV